MKATRQLFLAALGAMCALVILLAGCSGNGGSGVNSASATTGTMKVSLTDAPTADLDHVWITVKEIRFHVSSLCDDPGDSGWLRYPLAAPVTLDLAALNNGRWDTLWNGITLPVGSYQQIRVILAGTYDTLSPSAKNKGLRYNNQVSDDGAGYPLVIPAAQNGIKLIGSFRVTAAEPVHIVIDFDITHDVVETGNGKYILKPRLKYHIVTDQQTAAIAGTVNRPDGTPFANYTGVKVIVKAEAPEIMTFDTPHSNPIVMVVMGKQRSTTVRGDGTFVLYPLPASAGTTYDLVIRGAGVRTMILQKVPAVPGTTKDDPSMVTVDIRPGRDYLVGAQVVNAETSPYEPAYGASVDFYQTLPGEGEIPYLIRSRDVNPLFGTFGDFKLAEGRLLVGRYNPNALIQSFTATTPLEGTDSYAAFASAPFFWPSGPKVYSPDDTFKRFLLTPKSDTPPPDCDLEDDGENESHSDKGYYVISGGLVVDHVRMKNLENGDYDFQSTDVYGKDIRSHSQGDKVNLNNRNPVKIKIKNKHKN